MFDEKRKEKETTTRILFWRIYSVICINLDNLCGPSSLSCHRDLKPSKQITLNYLNCEVVVRFLSNLKKKDIFTIHSATLSNLI